jgi:glycerol uptake facilitator-like aquaporin
VTTKKNLFNTVRRHQFRSFSAEIFGTFFIVFFGCGSAINFSGTPVDLVQMS